MKKSRNTTSKPIAVLYARVSTRQQADDGVGLDAQLAKCRAHAERLGLDVADVFVDRAVSGKETIANRPASAPSSNT